MAMVILIALIVMALAHILQHVEDVKVTERLGIGKSSVHAQYVVVVVNSRHLAGGVMVLDLLHARVVVEQARRHVMIVEAMDIVTLVMVMANVPAAMAMVSVGGAMAMVSAMCVMAEGCSGVQRVIITMANVLLAKALARLCAIHVMAKMCVQYAKETPR